MNKWHTGLVLLLIAVVLATVSERLLHNLAMVNLNKAVGLETVHTSKRVAYFHAFPNLVKESRGTTRLAVEPMREASELLYANDYLRQHVQFDHYEATVQLLINPDFDRGKVGWIEYSSFWNQENVLIGNVYDAGLAFTRQGAGHSSINQVLFLESSNCYLFSAVAELERFDETANLWLYWETYELGWPQGDNIITNRGNQPWQRLDGVFCLPEGEGAQKVVVAPVSVYGNAEVSLASARLYQLREKVR